MLGKVLKYELRSNGRLLLPFFGLAIAVCGVLRLLLLLAPHIWAPAGTVLTGLASTLGPLVLVAVWVLCFVALLVRFWQSMAGNEAYLTFTLPVKTGTHLLARLLSSILFALLSVLVVLVCGWVLIPGFFSVTVQGFSVASVYIGPGVWFSLIAWVLALIITGFISTFLLLYASIAIGTQFSRHRIAGSIAGYFVLNAVESFLMLPLVLLPLGQLIGWNENAVEQRVLEMSTVGITDPTLLIQQLLGYMWMILGIGALVVLVIGALNYCITLYLFSKRLNLE